MGRPFDSFVIFAEMRTGSNLLEEHLNLFPDLECLGETFNPHFLAYPETESVLGISLERRDQVPHDLLQRIFEPTENLRGFRYFHDHDPRVLDQVLENPRCAKVILTRNPIDSFVSWKIAEVTGQWKLTNATHLKAEKVKIDPEEFIEHLGVLQQFQVTLLNRLQKLGQVPFYLSYEDVQDLSIINGLGRFLGSIHDLPHLGKRLKKQNPNPMAEKIENFEEIEAALVQMDRFNLNQTPNFEPRRGPNAPQIILAAQAGLMFLPVPMGPTGQVVHMLAGLDAVQPDDLPQQLSQKELRKWKRQNKNHRSFTVVRHPVLRAYNAFCKKILSTGAGSFPEIRKTLRRVHNLPIPEDAIGPDFSPEDMKAAFVAFLKFVKANLNGQTAMRVDGAWASQTEVIAGFSGLFAPDMIIREHMLEVELGFLAIQVGSLASDENPPDDQFPIGLNAIYDQEIEALVKDAYPKDYLNFGFAPYRKYQR